MNKVRGMNKWKWHALAQLFHEEVIELKGKIAIKKYPVEIFYDYHWTKKPLDSINSALMSKLLEDGLVKAEVLVDDSERYVRRSVLQTQRSNKYEHDTVVITITALYN